MTSTIQAIGSAGTGRSTVRVTVPAGETSPWIIVTADSVVCASPGAGGTMYAEATWSPQSIVEADNANSTSNSIPNQWDQGIVSVARTQSLINATAVRFTATAAQGIGEVARR